MTSLEWCENPGGGGTPYDGLIGEAPREWGIFFRRFRVTDVDEKRSLLPFNEDAITFVLIDIIANCLYLLYIFGRLEQKPMLKNAKSSIPV